MSILVIDLETTGLPEKNGYRFYSPTQLEKYENARITQFRYVMYDKPNPLIIGEGKFDVLPDNLVDLLDRTKCIVMHSVNINMRILLSELYRANMLTEYNKMLDIPTSCIMRTYQICFGVNEKCAAIPRMCDSLRVCHQSDRRLYYCALEIEQLIANTRHNFAIIQVKVEKITN